MPTAIQAYEDGSSGSGLTGEHELCALASDHSDEPTEVTVLLFNNEGDNEQQENVGTSQQLSVPSLTDEHSLFDDIDSGSAPPVMYKPSSKHMPKKALAANHIQVGELKEVNCALNNHMSAVLRLLRQTAAESVMNIPESLINPLREQTMTALRDADYCFSLSRALLVPENDAIQLYAEEIMKKKKQRLEAMNNGGTDNEGQLETKTKAVLVASASGNNATTPPPAAAATSKRARSDNENEKVARKQYRKKCSADGCTNIAQKGGVCWRHGANVKCSSEGCANYAINGGVCVRHGAKTKRCSSEGCTNEAKKGGVCWKHGAKDLMKE